MHTVESLTAILKQAGMRITPQRIAICRLLCETSAHPTAGQIYEHVREDYPSLALATVYNTLDALVGLGAINTLGAAGDNHVHFDADTSPHVNLACVSCHKIIDIDTAHVSDLAQEVSASSGYRLVGARVMYYGLCPECQAA